MLIQIDGRLVRLAAIDGVEPVRSGGLERSELLLRGGQYVRVNMSVGEVEEAITAAISRGATTA